MKLFFEGNYPEPPRLIMRRCGYGEQVTRSSKVSYVRSARPGIEFPRFHAYLDYNEKGFRVNLHFDQKAACYTGTTAHSGEYDGPVVIEEATRIRSIVESGHDIGGFTPLRPVRGTGDHRSPSAPLPPMRFG